MMLRKIGRSSLCLTAFTISILGCARTDRSLELVDQPKSFVTSFEFAPVEESTSLVEQEVVVGIDENIQTKTIEGLIESKKSDTASLQAGIEAYLNEALDPLKRIKAIILLLDKYENDTQKSIGLGVGSSISLVALVQPELATVIINEIMKSGKDKFIKSVQLGMDSKTAAVGSDTKNCNKWRSFPSNDDFPTTRNCFPKFRRDYTPPARHAIYDFMPTNREEHYFDITHPKDGLVSYILLIRESDKERNRVFLNSFFSVTSLVSAISNSDSNTYTSDGTFNLFLFPVRSYQSLKLRLERNDAPPTATDVLLIDEDGYDYIWANSTLEVLCKTFADLQLTAPCVDPNARGPFLFVTYKNQSLQIKPRLLLVDLSDRQNQDAFREDVFDLISNQRIDSDEINSLRSETEIYSNGKASTIFLDAFISASSYADMMVEHPSNWFTAIFK